MRAVPDGNSKEAVHARVAIIAIAIPGHGASTVIKTQIG